MSRASQHAELSEFTPRITNRLLGLAQCARALAAAQKRLRAARRRRAKRHRRPRRRTSRRRVVVGETGRAVGRRGAPGSTRCAPSAPRHDARDPRGAGAGGGLGRPTDERHAAQTSPRAATRRPTPPPTPARALLLDVDGSPSGVARLPAQARAAVPSDKGARTATVSGGIALGVEMDPVAAARGDGRRLHGDARRLQGPLSTSLGLVGGNIFTDLFKGTLKDAVVKAIDNTVATTWSTRSSTRSSRRCRRSSRSAAGRVRDLSLIITDFTTRGAARERRLARRRRQRHRRRVPSCRCCRCRRSRRAARRSSMAQLLLSDNTLACVLWVDFSNGALDFDGVRAGTTKLPWGPILPKLAKRGRQARDPPPRRLLHAHPRLAARRASTHRRLPRSTHQSSRPTTSPVRTRTRSPSPPTPGSTCAWRRRRSDATLVGNVSSLTLDASVADCGALCPMPFTNSTLALFTKAFSATVRAALDGASKGIRSPAEPAPSGWSRASSSRTGTSRSRPNSVSGSSHSHSQIGHFTAAHTVSPPRHNCADASSLHSHLAHHASPPRAGCRSRRRAASRGRSSSRTPSSTATCSRSTAPSRRWRACRRACSTCGASRRSSRSTRTIRRARSS